MLRLDKLSKRYGAHPVFQGLTYSFSPGCFALCEEESSGKSSLLAIIAGVLEASDGDVWIDGHSLGRTPKQAKPRVAYVPDDCLQQPMMTGRELLTRMAAEKHSTLDSAVLDFASRLELDPHLDKRFEQMSTGMRRKVYLTAAMLGDPAVIVADGPTSGLDARACAVVAEQFKIWGKNKVVLFASHDETLVGEAGATSVQIAQLQA